MEQYVGVINSQDMINVVTGKITVDELKDKKLRRYYAFCKNDNEKKEALQFIEEAFKYMSHFLSEITVEEFDALAMYGRKIGSNSYEINDALREGKHTNETFLKLLDSAISKFELKEDIIVYRALKGAEDKYKDSIGKKINDKGYMSTALTKEDSYAYFEKYETVLEIKVPAGSKCIYLEWFKGSNDENELLLGRGYSLLIVGMKKEIINGREKNVYICELVERDKDSQYNKEGDSKDREER